MLRDVKLAPMRNHQRTPVRRNIFKPDYLEIKPNADVDFRAK